MQDIAARRYVLTLTVAVPGVATIGLREQAGLPSGSRLQIGAPGARPLLALQLDPAGRTGAEATLPLATGVALLQALVHRQYLLIGVSRAYRGQPRAPTR